MTKRKSSFLIVGVKMLLLLINALFILLLLLTYLAPHISPERFFLPSMLGLFYPVWLIINILFVIFWLIRLKYYFIFSLAALLAGWNVHVKNIAFNFGTNDEVSTQNIKFISYNVRLFDQFKWSEGQNYFTRDAIFSFINRQSPDIINFQEFFHGNNSYFPTIGPFLQSQRTTYYHVDYVKMVNDKKHYGLATFSRFPIVGKGAVKFDNSTSNSGIYSDILINKDTIRVFNFHLESIRLSNADYQYVTEFIDPGFHSTSSTSQVILGKFKNAFTKRAEQARIVTRAVQQSPYPVIISGDFNDTPVSYVYQQISSGLHDAFLEAGLGFGSTYAGRLPFIRIDYVLHSSAIEAEAFERHKVFYSDHFPVTSYFRLKPKTDELRR
ncbi:MAG: hypothetical protein EOM06_03210 [Sphingobacteriia bacterium]|nr:hypothetical protein [Sphingobacteriia bacterium]